MAFLEDQNSAEGTISKALDPSQSVLRVAAGSFALWTAMSIFAMIQTYQMNDSHSAEIVILQPLLRYWIWSLLSVPLYFASRRFPLTLKSLQTSIPVHLVLCATCNWVATSLRWILTYLGLRQPWSNSYRGLLREQLTSSFVANIWTYGAVIAVSNAIYYYLAARDRQLNEALLREKLARHEFQMLKLRLHPHFLFNTLNGISALMATNASKARTALAQLSDLLRMSLNHSERELIDVREELDFVSSYVALQEMRFPDRLTVTVDVDEGLLHARLPNMILQPLVENAIRHGVETLNCPGTISIKIFRLNERLCIHVGNPTGRSRSVRGQGIGLSNVRTRLQSIFGDSQSLQFTRNADSSVTVFIALPLIWGTTEATHRDKEAPRTAVR